MAHTTFNSHHVHCLLAPTLQFLFSTSKLEHAAVRGLNGKATDPELGDIATLSGYFLHRQKMDRGQFHELMDDADRELSDLSVVLFDKNGHLKSSLKTGYRSGTGCWGDELDDGVLVYIADIYVDERYRRQGIGSLFLQAFAEWKVKPKISTILCAPSTQADDPSVAFFRKNGFRRIGRTVVFGYALDPGHPSRHILPSDDIQDSLEDSFSVPDDTFSILRLTSADGPDPRIAQRQNLRQRFPIHCASGSDRSLSIISTLRSAYNANPISIHTRDDLGLLPMHVAVQAKNFLAFYVLLGMGRREDLHDYKHKAGTTPLEFLRDFMVDERVSTERVLPGKWCGYPEEDLSMEYAVKKAMGMDTGCTSVEEYVAKNRFGCTCGGCSGGWLSPRMAFQLSHKAGEVVDKMHSRALWFQESPTLTVGSSKVEILPYVKFLPATLYSWGLHLSVYRGFAAAFLSIKLVLEETPIPTLTAGALLAQALSGAYTEPIGDFLDQGGKVEYALDGVTVLAKYDSLDFDLRHGAEEAFVRLPRCENDYDFALVRTMVGLCAESER